MSGPDEDFDDFLSRRKPVFRRPPGEVIEPPEDIDRVVLRQAREAIEDQRHAPLYRGPGWGVPLAVAATVLLALSVVLHVGLADRRDAPEIAAQRVSQRLEPPPAAPTADAPPMAPVAAETAAVPNNSVPAARSAAPADSRQAATAGGPADQGWRRDTQSWLAEIDRLRAAGRNAEAEAELAEFKRQNRAYAGAPDR